MKFTLVSCVKKKRRSKCAAQDLYLSTWFQKARQHVYFSGTDWFILSAKYGLVQPGEEIEPYERTLNTMTSLERKEWAIATMRQILEAIPGGSTIQIFAGDRYRQYLVPLLEQAGYVVEVPLRGMGIGKQLAWLSTQDRVRG